MWSRGRPRPPPRRRDLPGVTPVRLTSGASTWVRTIALRGSVGVAPLQRVPERRDRGTAAGIGDSSRTRQPVGLWRATLTDQQDQAHDADGRNEEKPYWHGEKPPSRGDLPSDVQSDDVGNDDDDAQNDDPKETTFPLTPMLIDQRMMAQRAGWRPSGRSRGIPVRWLREHHWREVTGDMRASIAALCSARVVRGVAPRCRWVTGRSGGRRARTTPPNGTCRDRAAQDRTTSALALGAEPPRTGDEESRRKSRRAPNCRYAPSRESGKRPERAVRCSDSSVDRSVGPVTGALPCRPSASCSLIPAPTGGRAAAPRQRPADAPRTG